MNMKLKGFRNFFMALPALLLVFSAYIPLYADGGVDGGYLNVQYRTRDVALDKLEHVTSMDGFFVGASNDTDLFSGLDFHTGLYYSYVKDSFSSDAVLFSLAGTREDHSIFVPVHLKFNMDIIPEISIFVYAGPTLNFGFMSESNFKMSSSLEGFEGNFNYNYYTGKIQSRNISEEALENVNSMMADERYNWFGVTMGAGIGVEFIDLLELRFGYDWGLTDSFKSNSVDGMFCRRNMLQVSVGLRF